MTSRITFPRDWRDHLARAINERDLEKIEHMIQTGYEHHGRTRNNDPLIADACFLLQMAQDKTSQDLSHGRNRNVGPFQSSTHSKMVDVKAGGMSWIAPPIASYVSSSSGGGGGDTNQNNNNNMNNNKRSATLRDRVSSLKEMALFPERKQQQQQSDYFSNNTNTTAGGIDFSNISRSGSALTSSNYNYNNYRSASAISTTTTQNNEIDVKNRVDSEKAAVDMGVPSMWISPPLLSETETLSRSVSIAASNTNLSPQQRNNMMMSQHHSSDQRSRSAMSNNTSYSTQQHPFQEDNLNGKTLRLHSFMHSDDEPKVKSSRIFDAYVSAERNSRGLERGVGGMLDQDAENEIGDPTQQLEVSPLRRAIQTVTIKCPSRSPSQQHQHRGTSPNRSHQQQQDNDQEKVAATSQNETQIYQQQQQQQQNQEQREASLSTLSRTLSTPSQSPEHYRLIRKLRYEAEAPEDADLNRMIRFLRATELMQRGALEQSESSFRTNMSAITHYGISYTRGISSNRSVSPNSDASVFLDN